jgi:hypothetical protein
MTANPLSYVNYDFDQLVINIQNRLKASNAWQDIYRDGAGQMLIEFLAYVTNLGLYYTERRAEESYLATAKLLSSVKNIVSILNYQPRRKTSSTGTLVFSISSPLTKIVYIPKYTECQTSTGVKFVTNESIAIEKGQTSADASSIQGELIQKEVTSDGSTEQEYLVNDTAVENSADVDNPTFRVIVDGTEWTKVSSFLASGNTDQHFRVINEPEGTVSVLFGDDVSGKAPEAGSTIVIQYIRTAGADGNVTFSGSPTITTLNSTIYDEDGGIVTTTVSHTSSFLGGSDDETIEEIRYNAPRVFSTGERAVTKEDFVAILGNYSSVASVNVWGENEEAEAAGVAADYEMLNKVKISLVLQDWQLADSTFKSTLSDFLYDLSMITVKYEFVTPTFLLVIPVLDVKVVSGNSLSQAQADIESELADQFTLGDTTKLGTMIKYSNVLAAIDDLAGVAYASMDLEIKKALSSTYDSMYDWGAALEATDILPESARLFIDGVYVTTDVDGGSGSGTFSSAGGYTISGTIDYSTGVALLDVSPAPSAVHIRYRQDENDNIVPSFNQICKLEDTDIQSISIES